MSARLELVSTLIIISLCCVSISGKSKPKVRHGPRGMSFNDTTTCHEFSKFARFNPYSVLYEKWVVFYYWAPPMGLHTYIFTFPTANHTKHLHKLLDGKTILPVNWSARQILMEDQNNETSLLVERGDRGEYWLYLLYRVTKGDKIKPRDVRLKQTADNRILGFMDCFDETLFVMSRINDVPPKKHLQEEAARLGFRGRRGKSYLYQGHEWMPIPEDDEKNYWAPPPKTRKSSEKSPNEAKSSERTSEGEDSPPTTVPEEPSQMKISHHGTELNVDERELKDRCIEIKPEYYHDPDNPDSGNKHRVGLTKQQLENLDTNEKETIQSPNVPDTSKLGNIPDNNLVKESESTHNNLDNHQNNEPKKVETVHESENLKLIYKEPQQSYEPINHLTTNSDSAVGCNDCFELKYVKSTDTNYIPENSLSNKNKRGSGKSVSSVESTKTTPQSSEESASPNASTERAPQTSGELVDPNVSSEGSPQSIDESEGSNVSIMKTPLISAESVGSNVSTERSLQSSAESVASNVSTERNPQISNELVRPQTANNPVGPEPSNAPVNSSS